MSAKSFENKIMQKSPKKECDTVETFRLISFDKIVDERGEITVLETANHLPFEVKRLFYVKNPIGEEETTHTRHSSNCLYQCPDH